MSLFSFAPLLRVIGVSVRPALRARFAKSISFRILALLLAVSAAYTSIPVLGIGQAHAQSNQCMSFDGTYWNCTQAQALAECKRMAKGYAEYRMKELFPYSWYAARPAAQNCPHSYSNSRTGRYLAMVEETTNGGESWNVYGIDYAYHTNFCTNWDCPPPRIDPAKNNECDDCSKVGNPINKFTGVKLETATDFRASSGPLVWARFYSSVPVISDVPQVMGKNWRHGYAHRLMMADTSSTGTAVLSRPSGNQYLFTRNASGVWLAEADVHYALVSIDQAGVRVGWRVTAPDNSEEHYDLDGRLIALTYPDGSALSLAYTNGNLTRVEDQQRRSLDLTYVNGLLDTVQLPDGKLIKYGFDAQQRLTSVGFQSNKSGTPQFDTIDYHYEDANRADALTGRTDETQGRYATWEYDTSGRATRSEHAGGVDKVLVSYTASGGSTVTNALGEAATHSSQILMGRARPTGSQKVCVGCGSGFLSRTYDANGNPDQSVDFRNGVTDYDYNVRGLVQQRIDAATDTQGRKRTTQTDWHATFAVPIERRTYDAAGVLVKREVWTYNSRGQVLTHSVHEL